MHDDLLQQIATFALVGGAALYVIRRVWNIIHPSGNSAGCGGGGCSSCPSAAGSPRETAPQIVTIGMPTASRRSNPH